MIIDSYKNLSFYKNLLPCLTQGLEVAEALPNNAEPGRYEFEGGFFLLQSGFTKKMEEGLFEAHRRYIDVQIVLEGSEEVAWADVSALEKNGPYQRETDKAMYHGKEDITLMVRAGMCYIAFPQDAHKAARHTEQERFYKKIVMKLPYIGEFSVGE